MNLSLIIWFVIILCVEAFALYYVRKSSDDNGRWRYLIISCLLYLTIPILLYLILVKTHKIAILNGIWNIASTIYGLMIGILIFSEIYTTKQYIGIILGLFSLILMI